MKNDLTYLLLFLAVAFSSRSQELQLSLAKGESRLFGGMVYAYGLTERGQQVSFAVYKMDTQLKLKDSLIVSLGKTQADTYLQPFSDTLHNYLSICLQQKDKKEVTIFRFNRKFELLARIEHVEIARLNNTALFTDEAFYSGNSVYTIKTQTDTSGRQFYLNKYALRSDTKNFDYGLAWQFPFERKEIRSAHIFYADARQVLMQVHVASGKRAGQWLLKVDAQTGKLVRGTKINGFGETNVYLFGKARVDTANKTTWLIGEKLTAAQFSEKENTLNIGNRSFATVYLVSIDSTDEVSDRQEFKVPITTAGTNPKKTSSSHLLKIQSLLKNADNSFSFEADIYSAVSGSLCYNYINTQLFRLIQGDDKLLLEKTAIVSNPLIEKFYFNNDKLDMNGRLCIDSVSRFERMMYRSPVLPVKQGFKMTQANPSFLLSRSGIKKNTTTYSVIQPVNRIYQLIQLDEIPKDANPSFLVPSDQVVLIGKQTPEKSYLLKLYKW